MLKDDLKNKMINEFQKIKIEDFVKKTLERNPDLDEKQLAKSLEEFKIRKKKGKLCDCGEPIWIIGSALTGRGCFTCITGETNKTEDYEID